MISNTEESFACFDLVCLGTWRLPASVTLCQRSYTLAHLAFASYDQTVLRILAIFLITRLRPALTFLLVDMPLKLSDQDHSGPSDRLRGQGLVKSEQAVAIVLKNPPKQL